MPRHSAPPRPVGRVQRAGVDVARAAAAARAVDARAAAAAARRAAAAAAAASFPSAPRPPSRAAAVRRVRARREVVGERAGRRAGPARGDAAPTLGTPTVSISYAPLAPPRPAAARWRPAPPSAAAAAGAVAGQGGRRAVGGGQGGGRGRRVAVVDAAAQAASSRRARRCSSRRRARSPWACTRAARRTRRGGRQADGRAKTPEWLVGGAPGAAIQRCAVAPTAGRWRLAQPWRLGGRRRRRRHARARRRRRAAARSRPPSRASSRRPRRRGRRRRTRPRRRCRLGAVAARTKMSSVGLSGAWEHGRELACTYPPPPPSARAGVASYASSLGRSRPFGCAAAAAADLCDDPRTFSARRVARRHDVVDEMHRVHGRQARQASPPSLRASGPARSTTPTPPRASARARPRASTATVAPARAAPAL